MLANLSGSECKTTSTVVSGSVQGWLIQSLCIAWMRIIIIIIRRCVARCAAPNRDASTPTSIPSDLVNWIDDQKRFVWLQLPKDG
jgi:hypothetical protein